MKNGLIIVLVIAIVVAVAVSLKPRESANQDNRNSINQQQESKTDNQCIVTISGENYDVSTLRGIHPGGDIFICNTDMTETFQGQHGMDKERIAKYKI